MKLFPAGAGMLINLSVDVLKVSTQLLLSVLTGRYGEFPAYPGKYIQIYTQEI